MYTTRTLRYISGVFHQYLKIYVTSQSHNVPTSPPITHTSSRQPHITEATPNCHINGAQRTTLTTLHLHSTPWNNWLLPPKVLWVYFTHYTKWLKAVTLYTIWQAMSMLFYTLNHPLELSYHIATNKWLPHNTFIPWHSKHLQYFTPWLRQMLTPTQHPHTIVILIALYTQRPAPSDRLYLSI